MVSNFELSICLLWIVLIFSLNEKKNYGLHISLKILFRISCMQSVQSRRKYLQLISHPDRWFTYTLLGLNPLQSVCMTLNLKECLMVSSLHILYMQSMNSSKLLPMLTHRQGGRKKKDRVKTIYLSKYLQIRREL